LSSLGLSVCLSQSQTYFFGAKESPLNQRYTRRKKEAVHDILKKVSCTPVSLAIVYSTAGSFLFPLEFKSLI
jgi:hypothetical protein